MLTFGYTIGILSEAPDGLERSLMDARSESWLEELPAAWEPILSWISNDYVAGILGILLTLIIILGFFYGLRYIRTKTQEDECQQD
jgi:hypothetical protein